MMRTLLFVFLVSFHVVGFARHASDHPLTAEDWEEVMQKISLLDDASLMPSLMPFVMANRDALQLTPQQIKTFHDWRKNNFVEMVNIMNQVIAMKVQFRAESMKPEVSAHHLMGFQARIQQLQRDLLRIRLSCRDLILGSFTEEQWDNFAFIASDHPKFASLLNQAEALPVIHDH